MSLQPHASSPIPEDTQRVARAAFPHGNIYRQVADRLGNMSHDEQCTALFRGLCSSRTESWEVGFGCWMIRGS